MDNSRSRLYPTSKPENHVPPVQRYSARFPKSVTDLQILYLGVQSVDGDESACLNAIKEIRGLFEAENGPDQFDFAQFIDPAGYLTLYAVGYWITPATSYQWRDSSIIQNWWNNPAKETGSLGYFMESIAVPTDQSETLKFPNYVRGLSACPASQLQPVKESAYWGASRDRIPATAFDRFDSPVIKGLQPDFQRHVNSSRVSIPPPQNMCVIRSGVTWMNCGNEQRRSYETKLKPKLDAGMEYLRLNPVDTGCYSLRQVDVISDDGTKAKEAYSLGYFRSLEDLETWAKEHPSHLAIYTRALAERKKYGKNLELLTYHEIFILNAEDSLFQYTNCHSATGLLPYFNATSEPANAPS